MCYDLFSLISLFFLSLFFSVIHSLLFLFIMSLCLLFYSAFFLYYILSGHFIILESGKVIGVLLKYELLPLFFKNDTKTFLRKCNNNRFNIYIYIITAYNNLISNSLLMKIIGIFQGDDIFIQQAQMKGKQFRTFQKTGLHTH